MTSSSRSLHRQAPLWALGAAFWATVVLVLVARATGAGDVAGLGTGALIFSSILIEALPFVLVGAVASAVLHVYVPSSAFARFGSLPRVLQVPAAAVAGFAFPVCECGSVPVARGLIRRGVHPSASVAFMLSAPIVNPIVLASTWIAFRGRGIGAEMVLARAGLGLTVAMLAAWAIAGRRGGAEQILRGRVDVDAEEHDHDHQGERTSAFLAHVTSDFLYMGRFLVVGAALSAILQTLVPQRILGGIAGTPVLAVLALMALAFMLALCSEADAFVAVSFVAFPLSAQLAFLVFGPALDAKLTVLYGATFRDRFALRLLAVAAPVVLVGSLVLGALIS